MRDTVLSLFARPTAEVLIIGGGINGIATFRDLVLQGLDVVLIERDDFLSGASAASSHMIHGGIRYLENGEFRLVRESVVERNRLLRLAPHYVRPLETTIPIYSTFSGILRAPLRFFTHKAATGERGALLIKVGLTIYDTFSRAGGTVPRHRFLGRRRALAELPRLAPNLKYTATYFDASVHDPERLGLDLLQDALAAGGGRARAANRVAAVGAGSTGVVVRDAISGETWEITAPVVVNATGPWADGTNTRLGTPSEFMGGTKGSHIVLDHPELLEATHGREIFFEHTDGRIVLIYPIKGRVLVGTTDLEHDMAEPIACTDAEVDYFIELVGHVFPTIEVLPEHIVFRYAGVRPLPHHRDLEPGFVSRDYRIERAMLAPAHGTTVLSLVGGKWTTFRAVSEHLADAVLELIGAPRTTDTTELPIGGGRGYPVTAKTRDAWLDRHATASTRARAIRLLERYGTRATEILEQEGGNAVPLDSVPDFTAAELRHLARNEQVVHLDDLLLRRTDLAFTGRVTLAVAREIAEAVRDVLGWDDAAVETEVAVAWSILAGHGAQAGLSEQPSSRENQ